jgi:hypothetical protein
MKTLILGVVLIVLIGMGGFFYRNVAERTVVPEQVACTAEAKICPDGSTVGREGPQCAFTPCAYPNIEAGDAGIAFVAPVGYTQEVVSVEEGGVAYFFIKPTASDAVTHRISVKRLVIPEGKTAEDVILVNTIFYPADMPAEDMSRFEPVLVNGKVFQSVVIERFEALVHSAYYLVRTDDVLKFEVVEHDVTDWMNPDLVVGELPEHKALLTLLGTLQVAP